jgi:hypothetical protein
MQRLRNMHTATTITQVYCVQTLIIIYGLSKVRHYFGYGKPWRHSWYLFSKNLTTSNILISSIRAFWLIFWVCSKQNVPMLCHNFLHPAVLLRYFQHQRPMSKFLFPLLRQINCKDESAICEVWDSHGNDFEVCSSGMQRCVVTAINLWVEPIAYIFRVGEWYFVSMFYSSAAMPCLFNVVLQIILFQLTKTYG